MISFTILYNWENRAYFHKQNENSETAIKFLAQTLADNPGLNAFWQQRDWIISDEWIAMVNQHVKKLEG